MTLIDIGERAGSGIPHIFDIWKKQGWKKPEYAENIERNRTTLKLSIESSLIQEQKEKVTIKSDDKKNKTNIQKEIILQYLEKNTECKLKDLSELLDVKSTRAKQLIYLLIEEKKVVASGSNKNRTYKLNK